MDIFFEKPTLEESEIVRLRHCLMKEIRYGFELEHKIEEKDKFIIELLNKIKWAVNYIK